MRPTCLLVTFALVAVTASAGETRPEPPKAPRFDVANIDRSVEPCADFFGFACGNWIAHNPIPPDESRWGRFNELIEANREVLRGILEKASFDDPARDPDTKKIGDYYAACMDEAGVEARGLKGLSADLGAIAALSGARDLPPLVGRLHAAGVGALFAFGAVQDYKDATTVIASLDQGGLGLPDRDYYLKDDPKSVELRKAYQAHVARMLALLGDSKEQAAKSAEVVLEIETRLARASMDRVSRRDPEKRYHKMPRAQAAALFPSFAWEGYLAALDSPAFRDVNVGVPDFFKGLEASIKEVPVAHWRTYLRWHLVHASAGALPAAFVNEDFAFYGKTLSGQKELKPRWKRCVAQVDDALGEALGKPYVERTFGADGKERMQRMVGALEKALEKDIRELPWMTEATKPRALAKLAAIANKIGYPDAWRDYSALQVSRSDALGNAQRAEAFELRRQLAKIGKPVDKKEWTMTPPTVNAYYQALMNSINFPAGILQPPFFDRSVDDAVNYGGIGAVIGHELTHGFDDQGRKFDGDGNMTDWWTEADGKEFEARAACVDRQYSGYTAVDDVKLNGKLTLGENVADNGGLRISLMALEDSLAGRASEPKDGFTPEQRFFLGFAQVWCQNATPEAARLRAQTDPHSPGQWRVNGTVSNMPEFQAAFGCKAGSPMVRENACRVW
jgi:endothelin-converting enzyme/putative endopeptidase